jgi:hypothetical protein
VNNHYRFASTARNVRELTKRVNGVTRSLFSQHPAERRQQHEVVLEALGARPCHRHGTLNRGSVRRGSRAAPPLLHVGSPAAV